MLILDFVVNHMFFRGSQSCSPTAQENISHRYHVAEIAIGQQNAFIVSCWHDFKQFVGKLVGTYVKQISQDSKFQFGFFHFMYQKLFLLKFVFKLDLASYHCLEEWEFIACNVRDKIDVETSSQRYSWLQSSREYLRVSRELHPQLCDVTSSHIQKL